MYINVHELPATDPLQQPIYRHTSGRKTSTTYYVRDAEGNVMTMYKKAENIPFRTDEYPRTILIVGLGNVRVVIGVQPESDGGAEVLVASSYWPYGSLMSGRRISAGNYAFGFNGMRMDNEVSGVGRCGE